MTMTPDSAPADPGVPPVDPGSAPADPAAVAAGLAARLDPATSRLLQTARAITDEQAREPSRLPGWSRGHLLTHLARNADGLRNLLIWARTGVETPQYPDSDARERGIADGAGRPAAELLDDVETSAAALAAEAAILTAADWSASVHGIVGRGHPAWYTLWRRLSEVEIHHVDLGAGYEPAQWPREFAIQCLGRVAGDFVRPEAPAAALASTDSGRTDRIGPAESQPAVTVSGPAWQLLAWLTGRADGDGLTAEPAGPLPALPSW
jgi:maleylpyruvate isomerase